MHTRDITTHISTVKPQVLQTWQLVKIESEKFFVLVYQVLINYTGYEFRSQDCSLIKCDN